MMGQCQKDLHYGTLRSFSHSTSYFSYALMTGVKSQNSTIQQRMAQRMAEDGTENYRIHPRIYKEVQRSQ